jgi:glucose/mannose-6-phosphate isomerase
MLDYPEKMLLLDKSDMLGTLTKFPQLVESGRKAASKVKLDLDQCAGGIRFLGLGGSAIGGDFIRDWLGGTIAGGVTVDRGFEPSAPLRKDDLVICCSYSGNTVETLSMLNRAMKSKVENVVLISSDGELAAIARSKRLPFIKLEKVPMPRASLPLVFSSVATICDRVGLTKKAGSSLTAALGSCRNFIKNELAIKVPTEKNPAKQIAHTVHGFVPVAIAPVTMESIARRWKTQMNENAKQHCFFGTFPELSHNEIVPWLRDKRSQIFTALLLHDFIDDPKMKKGFDKFRGTISGSVRTIDVQAHGKSRIEVMMNHILLADFASVYSAFLSGVDPTPVDEITNFKKR